MQFVRLLDAARFSVAPPAGCNSYVQMVGDEITSIYDQDQEFVVFNRNLSFSFLGHFINDYRELNM